MSGDVMAHLTRARRRGLKVVWIGEGISEPVRISNKTAGTPGTLTLSSVNWRTADWLIAGRLAYSDVVDGTTVLRLTEAGRELAGKLFR